MREQTNRYNRKDRFFIHHGHQQLETDVRFVIFSFCETAVSAIDRTVPVPEWEQEVRERELSHRQSVFLQNDIVTSGKTQYSHNFFLHTFYSFDVDPFEPRRWFDGR